MFKSQPANIRFWLLMIPVPISICWTPGTDCIAQASGTSGLTTTCAAISAVRVALSRMSGGVSMIVIVGSMPDRCRAASGPSRRSG